MHADSRVMTTSAGCPMGSELSARRYADWYTPQTPTWETIKRTVRPYFVLQGNICALLATKDHVNVFIYDPTLTTRTAS